MNVQFVAFQTPHADSFCHSCDITSRSESGRLSSSLRTAGRGGRVGVEDRDRLRTSCRERFPGDCDCDSECEYGRGWLARGAVEVKYPGESSSDSASEG